MRKLLIGAAILVALAGGAVFAYVNEIVGGAIERGATRALGVDTRVGLVSLTLLGGDFALRGLSVDNPPGFDADRFLTLDRAAIQADLGTLRTAVQRVLAGEKYYCEASSRLLLASLSGPSVSADVALTPREREVLRAYARGENTRATAQRLAIAEKTVQNTLTSLRDKLGLHEPAALVHYAIKHGYVSIDR